MPVQVTRNFGSLADLQLVTEDDMRQIGLLAREIIVRRTIDGRDVDGGDFQPYSDGYAKAKRQALGTDRVNLQVSGAMLNDLTVVDVQVEPEQASVTLGWSK